MPRGGLDIRSVSRGKHIRRYECQGGVLSEHEVQRLSAELQHLHIQGVQQLTVHPEGVMVEKKTGHSWGEIGVTVYKCLWVALVASVNPPRVR